MEQKTYCCKTGAMQILGLTHKQFQKLGLKPAEYMQNAWHPGWVHCFDQQFIESLVNDPKVLSLRSKGRVPGKAIGRYCNHIIWEAKEHHKSATGKKAVEPDTAWVDELDWKERNDIEVQLADQSPTMDDCTDWTEKLDWQERNQIEIQMADPLLDAWMTTAFNSALASTVPVALPVAGIKHLRINK